MTQPNIRKSVTAWNEWRISNPDAIPYLEGAYLYGAYLYGAKLEGAYLEGAYLKGAYLEGAYLKGAYLKGANLYGAYLEGAYLEGAYLEGAYLEGVTGVIDAGTTARGYRMVAVCHESDVYVASGCRWFTSAEALAYWSMANADYVARHGATTVARMAVRVRALIEEARLFGWTVAAPREEV